MYDERNDRDGNGIDDEIDAMFDDLNDGEGSGDDEQPSNNDYIHVVVPDDEYEDADGCWVAYLPGVDGEGNLDWDNLTYVEGVMPSTTLARQALNAVPKKLKDDPLLAMKESDENLLRLCLRVIGDATVTWASLRGDGLDRHLPYKLQQMVSAYFGRLTQPTRDEVDAFLGTVISGKRRKRRR